MKQRFYTAIAGALQALYSCQEKREQTPKDDTGTRAHWADMADMHQTRIEAWIKAHAPHGSGFDNGTRFDWNASTIDKLVFQADFHHMDDYGYYCGWSEHTVTVRPSLAYGITVKVSGRNMRQIKDYISELFHYLNSIEVE